MQPLPEHAYASPLRTRQIHALGVTERELEGPLWRSPLHGVHAWVGAGQPDDTRQRILAVAAVLPDGAAIGGWAAGFLHGATWLDGQGPTGEERWPVPVYCRDPDLRLRRDGVRPLRSRLTEGDLQRVDGIPVTSPVRTAMDAARAGDLSDGVVALDAILRATGLDPAELQDYVDERRKWRGVPVLRKALALADPRSRSAGESRLRVLWVVDAGLPRPHVNPSVFDLNGHLLGEVDLLDPEAALVGEYDGAGHRGEIQHAQDNAREEWLENSGLVVARFGAVDLGRWRRRSVHRLRTERARGIARDRARDRWTWREAAVYAG